MTIQSREELEKIQAAKQHNARVQMALDEVYGARFGGRVLKPTVGTTKHIIFMCADYHGLSESVCVPSVQTLNEIYRLQPVKFRKEFNSLLITVEEARREVIENILLALRCGRPGITDWELAQEQGKLANGFTLQALRNRLRYVLEAQRLARKSVPEIKNEVQEARAAAAPLPTRLPDEYTPEALRKKLREMSRSETDRFIQRWGLDKINARLQGRDSFVEVQ